MPQDLWGAANRPAVAGGVPRFSVIVPAWNEEAALGRCLRALDDQIFAGDVEVIVVDNGSTDATAAVARAHGSRVVTEPRPGVCFARQRGLESATGEIVVSTDADTTTSADWLQRIDELFRTEPGSVAVAGPCVYVDGPWWSRAWTVLLFGLVAGLAHLTGRVFYATATNLAYYRWALGAYNTSMTQGGDELDVLRQLRQRGRVVFNRRNATLTSSRRLQHGLLYTVVVTLVYQYGAAYLVNRLAGRSVIGAAPALRLAASELPRTVAIDRAPRRKGQHSAQHD